MNPSVISPQKVQRFSVSSVFISLRVGCILSKFSKLVARIRAASSSCLCFWSLKFRRKRAPLPAPLWKILSSPLPWLERWAQGRNHDWLVPNAHTCCWGGARRGPSYGKRGKGQLYVKPKQAELIEAERRMVVTRDLGVEEIGRCWSKHPNFQF